MSNKFFDFLKSVWFLWTLCLIFNIITLLVITYQIKPAGRTLALHYNIVTGVDWYGNGQNLYQIPGAAFLLTVLNFSLYKLLKSARVFYAPLTAGASLAVQIILFLTVLLLANIN